MVRTPLESEPDLQRLLALAAGHQTLIWEQCANLFWTMGESANFTLCAGTLACKQSGSVVPEAVDQDETRPLPRTCRLSAWFQQKGFLQHSEPSGTSVASISRQNATKATPSAPGSCAGARSSNKFSWTSTCHGNPMESTIA